MKQPLSGLRYAIYARKSSEREDRQMQSIGDQLKILRDAAQRENLTIVKEITEQKSAKEVGREGFTELLGLIQKEQVNALSCWDADRLARNMVDGGNITHMLQTGVIKVIKTPNEDYDENTDTMILNFKFGMATQYSRNLSKNVTRGIKSKLEKGIYTGLAPLGYINCPVDRDIKPSENFVLVRKMWGLMLTGSYTVPQILKVANEDWGFRTENKGKFGGKPLTRSVLYKMFNNKFYCGVMQWSGEEYEGIHKKMISAEEFERVQEIIGKKEKPREQKREFAYTGIIRCGECGCMVTAEAKKKKLKNGSFNHHQYYHCTRRSKYTNCSQKKSVKIDDMEEQISEKLSQIKIMPEFRDFALKLLREKHKQESNDQTNIQSSLEKSLKNAQGKMSKLTDLLIRELLSDEEYLEQKKQIQAEISLLKQKREQNEYRAESWTETAEQVFNFSLYAVENFNQCKNLKKKKEIFLSLGSNFFLKDREVGLDLNKWFEPIEKEYPALEREFKRLEPQISQLETGLNPALDSICVNWSG